MHRTPLAVLALFSAATLAAACSSSTASSTGARGSDLAPRNSVSAPTPIDTDSNRGTTSAAKPAPADGPASDLASFCTLITKNNAILQDIAAGDTSKNGVDTAKLLRDLDAAVAAAPPDIKGDLQTVVAFDRQIITKHADIKETPQLDAALQHYATWLGSHCAHGATS